MDRREAILNAIIRQFIETANPVGSHTIMVSYHMSISPATIRNEMGLLEEEGLIYQPHTSAGRIPTDLGYRTYVDKMTKDDYLQEIKHAERVLSKLMQEQAMRRVRERIYDAVALLAQATENVSFATLPDNRRTFYLGISNVLRQPEFIRDPLRASQVIEALENNDRFVNILRSLDMGDEVKIFIGRENLIDQIKSCSMIVARYHFGDPQADGFARRLPAEVRRTKEGSLDVGGFLGILGPTRMKYPFNRAVLEKVKIFLEEN